MQISYWWLLGDLLLALLEDIWRHLPLVLKYGLGRVIVCIANNYCMKGVWIGYLFYFLLVECMDFFFYKCVVEINVIQMWGFNNVITGYRLISKLWKKIKTEYKF